MVSFNVYRSTYSGAYVEGICLATDEKPVVGIANGSILYAVDISTGETTRYMYDQESMSWIEAACPCSGGSGSGSGGVEPLIVNVAEDESTGYTMDKTWKEIHDALAAGAQVVCLIPEIDNVDTLVTQAVQTITGAYQQTAGSSESGVQDSYLLNGLDIDFYAYSETDYPCTEPGGSPDVGGSDGPPV